MAWPDHFAKGVLSFLLIFHPHDCFVGWLGRIILQWVCFSCFSFFTHMIDFLDGLTGSICERVAFVSFFVSHMIALLNGLAGSFLLGLLKCVFMYLPDDCCFHYFYLPLFSLVSQTIVFWWFGRTTFHCLSFNVFRKCLLPG